MRAMNFIMQIKNGVVCLRNWNEVHTFPLPPPSAKIFYDSQCTAVNIYIENAITRNGYTKTCLIWCRQQRVQKWIKKISYHLDSPRKRVAKQFTQSLNLLPLISFYDRLATLMNLEDNNLMFGKLFFFLLGWWRWIRCILPE